MLKFALKDASLYLKLSKNSILGKFICFRLDALGSINDPIIAAAIYTRHRVSGRITKETAPGRFQDLEASTLAILSGERPILSGERPILHDVAVSSGITSVELYHSVKKLGVEFQLFVSDKYSRYYSSGRFFCKIYGVDKELIQAYCCNILADGKVSWNFPLSKILYQCLRKLDRPSKNLSVISLYDPKLLELIKSEKVKEITYDILTTKTPDHFTFVRCMNVLNQSYFTEDKILHALQLIKTSLRKGGVLLLGRTVGDGVNRATYYRKTESGHLHPFQDINGGSELKHIMSALIT